MPLELTYPFNSFDGENQADQPAKMGLSSDRVATAIAAPPTLGNISRTEPAGVLTSAANVARQGLSRNASPSPSDAGQFVRPIDPDNSAPAVGNSRLPAAAQGLSAATPLTNALPLNEVKAVASAFARDPSTSTYTAQDVSGQRTRYNLATDLAPVEVDHGHPAIDPRTGGVNHGPTTPVNGTYSYDRNGNFVLAPTDVANAGRISDFQKAVAQGLIDQNNPFDAKARVETSHQELANTGSAAVAGINADAQRYSADRAAEAKTGLTLGQRRTNAEVGAAREKIQGLSADDIKRRTQQYSATGRESPDFDPDLSKAVTLANRRMYGDSDPWFESRAVPPQPATKPSFTSSDVSSALAAGADRAKVAERIKSLGGNPADYGL